MIARHESAYRAAFAVFVREAGYVPCCREERQLRDLFHGATMYPHLLDLAGLPETWQQLAEAGRQLHTAGAA